MSRTVAEWIGKNDDSAVPDRVRDRVLKKFDHRCAGCGVAITDRRWTCDHVKALINGGENRESNMQPLGDRCCNKAKNRADVAEKAAVYRTRRAYLIRRKPKGRPMPGTIASGVKKKIDGTVIDRRTGKPLGRRA
jgi:5-methylcytosine-specific restriction protein A